MTPVHKGFVDVPHGQVHFRYGGSGPPVVMLHDAPRSSVQHVPNIEWLGDHFTVIALDTPGSGNSTPLPGSGPSIADFSAALAATLAALGIGRCALYGLHAGAAIALQFASDHTDRAGLTILDGLPMPETAADDEFLARCLPAFEPTDDGAHLARQWSLVLDSHRYLPWFRRSAGTRLQVALPDDLGLHEYATDLFMAGPEAASAMRAALGDLPAPAIGRLRSPAVFMAREDDRARGGLDRLPQPLPAMCRIETLPAETGAWRVRLLQLLRETGTPAARWSAPSPPAVGSAHEEQQRYVDLVHGQVHLRARGKTSALPPPLLLIHDAPGSSEQMRDLAGLVSQDRLVIAPDLPGLGESTPLPYPSLGSYVSTLSETLDELRVAAVDIVAEGLGTVFAIALAANRPAQVRRLVLDAVPWLRKRDRGAVARQYCPLLVQDRHGAYLQTAWHQLRDAEASWPWFDRRPSAARAREPDVEATRRQAVLVDVMKQLPSYGDAARAALEGALREILPGVRQPTLLMHDPRDVRYKGTARALSRLANARQARRPTALAERAALLREFLA
jgi:pimeloyl-ACP methyl ester carboxylesterase